MPTIIIRDGETPNWMFLPAGNESKLKTSSMGDCWALIIKNPDGSRLRAGVWG
jgi:hypothetical protein